MGRGDHKTGADLLFSRKQRRRAGRRIVDARARAALDAYAREEDAGPEEQRIYALHEALPGEI